MAECRSCQADIRWLKRHPVDAMPKKVIVLSDVSDGGAPLGKIVDGYTSHFATCPQANEWRG